jgi:zinc protease
MTRTFMIAMMLAAGAPQAHAGAFPFQVHEERLPNGLRVAFVPFDSPGLVAYYSLVRCGSRNEVEPGHSGFAHLFEHMMFRGTKRFPKFDETMARLGWHNNAYTSNDETVFTDFGPTDTLAQVIELEADRFAHLEYTEEAFKTETGAVLGEYNKNSSQPWQKLEEVVQDTAFTKHTYKHTTMGYPADVKAMPDKYDYSIKFLHRFYRPDNVVVFVVGDFDQAKVLEQIKAQYGSWEGKAEVPAVPTEPEQKEERHAKVDWPTETLPRLVIAYKIPAASDYKADAAADVLYAYLLGETSPLYKDLVLDKQIAEPFDTWASAGRDPFLWAFLATGKSDDAIPQIQKAWDAAIADVAAGHIDADRLARIKSNRRYGLILGLDDPEKVAGTMAGYVSPTGDLDAIDKFMAALDALTPDDVATFAKTYITPKRRTIVTLKQATAPAAPAKGGAK